MNEIVEFLPYLLNVFLAIQIVSAGAMCIYGYKWRKGLIATLSIYIGLSLGFLIALSIIKQDLNNLDFGALMIPVTAIVFYILAYRWVALNHFLTGFLVANKLGFMFIYNLMHEGIIQFDFDILMVVPIVLGFIAGFVLSRCFTHVAVLSCMVYIGTVELVTGVSDFINKSLFVATGDINFVFNMEDMLLKLVGVEIPSFVEVIFILVVGIASFVFQKNMLEKQGIDLSKVIVDDR